ARSRFLRQTGNSFFKKPPGPLADVALCQADPLSGLNQGLSLLQQQYSTSSSGLTREHFLTMYPTLKRPTCLISHLNVQGRVASSHRYLQGRKGRMSSVKRTNVHFLKNNPKALSIPILFILVVY